MDSFRSRFSNFVRRSNDANLMDTDFCCLRIDLREIHKSRDQHLKLREGDELLFQLWKIALNSACEPVYRKTLFEIFVWEAREVVQRTRKT